MPNDDSRTPTSQELALLDAVVRAVARSRRMIREDAEDFGQTVHLRLAERNYDVFRRFTGGCSLRTYLVVVVQRMLFDWQNHAFGKWRPSATATRLGLLAINLDRLIERDGYSVDQAVHHLCAARPDLDPIELHKLAAALPVRRRRHVLAGEFSEAAQRIGFEDPVEDSCRRQEAAARRVAIARAVAELESGDRQLIDLRYRRRQTVREIATYLQQDPRVLYRRFDRILRVLRQRLIAKDETGLFVLGF